MQKRYPGILQLTKCEEFLGRNSKKQEYLVMRGWEQ